MTRFSFLRGGALLLACLPTVLASSIDFTFEQPFAATGWSSIGVAHPQVSLSVLYLQGGSDNLPPSGYLARTPGAGSGMAELQGNGYRVFNGPTVSDLDNFLNAPNFVSLPIENYFSGFPGGFGSSLDNVTLSAIHQTFTANAGAIINFYWSWMFSNVPGNDRDSFDTAFFVLSSPSSFQLIPLASFDYNPTGNLHSIPGYLGYYTDWTPFQFTIPTSGTYTLSLAEVSGGGFGSRLLVDSAPGGTPFFTPEPGSLLLAGAGFALIAGSELLRRLKSA
jgi:hypothetical protein